jgi:lysozyme family protein
MTKVDQIIQGIVEREGGFVNHPNDRGGPTKYGVTIKTLEDWRMDEVTIADVQSLTIEKAFKIYRAKYFTKPKISQLPEAIHETMLDCSVHSGPSRAVKIMQACICETGIASPVIDGRIGPMTITAAKMVIDAMGPATTNSALIEQRRMFFERIIERDPTQEVFRKGWMNRLDHLEKSING